MTFAALLVTPKYDKRKVSLSLFAGERCSPLPHNLKAPSTAKTRNQIFHPLFLLHMQAQKKKLSKRKRRNKISRSAEHDHRCRWTPPPFEKGGRKLYREQTKILLQKKKRAQKKRRMPAAFHYSFFSPVFTIGSSSVSSEADCVFSPDATASAAFFGGTIVRFSSPRSVQVLNIASFAHPGPISS